MCFVRKGLDYIFTRHELKWLDDIIPESHKREKEERKKRLLASAVGLFAEVRFVELIFLHCIYDWTKHAVGNIATVAMAIAFSSVLCGHWWLLALLIVTIGVGP